MKEFEGKKLLVLGGFNLACVIVRHAQALGAYVVVADYNESAMAKSIADKFVLVSATDVEALVELCKKECIDGVTTGFVDILLQPCYEVCKRLGLPYYVTPKMLKMSTNKIDFKDTCCQYGVPVPRTYFIGAKVPDGVEANINYPVFVKPLDASGSRGAGICYNRADLDRQVAEAVRFSETNNAIVEDYIVGREFLMNYVAQDGNFRLVSMFDRYSSSDRGGAINYASLSVGPSKAIDYYYDNVEYKVVNMFKSLGFRDGLYFLQGYSDGNQITFFEMGCRLGGSYYDLERACIGIDPVDMIIRYALTGKMSDDISEIPARIGKYNSIGVCVNYLLIGGDETIFKIDGIEKIKKMSSYIESEQRQFEGDHYKNDNTVDRPVLSVYLNVMNQAQLIQDVNYMNSVFTVSNIDGKSLLKEKFNPELLYEYR